MTSNHKSHAFIMCHYNTAGIKTKVLYGVEEKKPRFCGNGTRTKKTQYIRRTRVPIYT